MKAEEFEKKFDEGKEDIVNDLDLSTARRANQEQKRINVDFPVLGGRVIGSRSGTYRCHAAINHQSLVGRASQS